MITKRGLSNVNNHCRLDNPNGIGGGLIKIKGFVCVAKPVRWAGNARLEAPGVRFPIAEASNK
ncbi:hypothetical protein [Nostoc sp.]|uniref:hypothetical protein n=1 Tax=Nostoc sp. TaxID=1180 RepID=UPI002FF95D88